jgi:16S rRNA (adenine1518-N6/adenine1519-N6)-dimethyltransferase
MLILKPLKKFGQNYLTDKNIINKIISEFNPQEEDSVIEIGPGTGALTRELINKVKKFKAIEIDTRVIDSLKKEMPDLSIINYDFLKLELTNLFPSINYIRIIGNIPYNITSPIIFKLIENRKIVADALLMIQYDVAKRITAKVGSKDYGILSVLLNYFAEVNLCFKISPNVFHPKPKVWSAIIHIKFDKQLNPNLEDEFFIKVVKASFGNRRKTLKNSLSNSIFAKINFDTDSLKLKRRAEELSVSDFIELSTKIKEQLDGRRD